MQTLIGFAGAKINIKSDITITFPSKDCRHAAHATYDHFQPPIQQLFKQRKPYPQMDLKPNRLK